MDLREYERRKFSIAEILRSVLACAPEVGNELRSYIQGLFARLADAALLERCSEDMKRYTIKHEGVRRYLASEEETTAVERGLLLIAGHRQVNFLPWQAYPADEVPKLRSRKSQQW